MKSMETEAKARILIVDDTPENIRLLVETLKDDHILLATKSGEKGLRLARTEPRPDLILLDIMMPGMDGYAVCEALKADPRTRDIPILFVTALTDERDEARGLALGAADYIVKPFRPAIVRARVRTQVERRRAEARVHQLRKAESLGRMAGAIAHHYNNLLMVVMGNLELAMLESGPSRPDSEFGPTEYATCLEEAMRATREASRIGRSMLTCLGHVSILPAPLRPADMIEGCLAELRASLPPGVALNVHSEAPDAYIPGDAEALRQMLGNLVANAGEAMEDRSGAISLGLGIVAPEGIPAVHRFPVDFQPGECDYICLSVADEGEGIPRENIERLFDPFFSTRFTGRGLGLPVALGIAKAHGGCIALSGASDGGTAFRVYLPLADEAPLRAEPSASGPTDFAHGRETRSDRKRKRPCP
jgi:signal transduction histidine kinase